jgi:hydrogenase maturation protein HypF
LKEGRIIAVKGLGGFSLPVMPQRRFSGPPRERKHRPAKPFAVMLATMEEVKRIVLSPAGSNLLVSAGSPIVLLPWHKEAASTRQ